MNTISKCVTTLAASVAALCGGVASAAPSYGNIVPPGVYFGSGNVNGDWTIDTSNGIEVALRAKNRDGAQTTINGSSGIYQANPGTCGGGIGCTGSPKALWNYEFSIDTQASGFVVRNLQNVFAQLGVDTNPGPGVNYTVLNVFNNWTDNEYWNGATKRIGTGPIAGEFGVQQSANPLFGDSGFQPGFDPFAPGLYDLQLSVFENNGGIQGALLAQTHTEVRVGAAPAAIPEPGSLALLGASLGAFAFSRRRKNRS